MTTATGTTAVDITEAILEFTCTRHHVSLCSVEGGSSNRPGTELWRPLWQSRGTLHRTFILDLDAFYCSEQYHRDDENEADQAGTEEAGMECRADWRITATPRLTVDQVVELAADPDLAGQPCTHPMYLRCEQGVGNPSEFCAGCGERVTA